VVRNPEPPRGNRPTNEKGDLNDMEIPTFIRSQMD
jgi:hypothetical protein